MSTSILHKRGPYVSYQNRPVALGAMTWETTKIKMEIKSLGSHLGILGSHLGTGALIPPIFSNGILRA